MRYIKFKMETDQEMTGEVGIVANIHRQWENYIPTQPYGLGHDLLDHASNERGYFYQEMAALGSSIFRNAFGDHLPNLVLKYSEAVASDIVSSYRDNQDIIDAPKFTLSQKDTNKLDKLLAEIRPEAVKYFESEYGYEMEHDSEYTNVMQSDETWSQVCGWIKYGFARAKRRFKGDAWGMYYLRNRIERVVKNQWASLIEWADSGREFTLVLEYGSGYVEVRGLDF